MRNFKGALVVALVGLVVNSAWGAFEITPAIQKELDRSIEVVRGWAADPAIVKAVLAQNEKGPLPGMDNTKWKTVRRSDDLIKGFQRSEAGQFLTKRCTESNGRYSEAFLSAERGEKVAFFEKTTSYIHKGMPKFDVPFNTGKAWQGQPEFDESSQTHEVQVAVPVLTGGKPIGVLVVGVSLAELEKTVKK